MTTHTDYGIWRMTQYCKNKFVCTSFLLVLKRTHIYFEDINIRRMTVRKVFADNFRRIPAFLQHACMHAILTSWVAVDAWSAKTTNILYPRNIPAIQYFGTNTVKLSSLRLNAILEYLKKARTVTAINLFWCLYICDIKGGQSPFMFW